MKIEEVFNIYLSEIENLVKFESFHLYTLNNDFHSYSELQHFIKIKDSMQKFLRVFYSCGIYEELIKFLHEEREIIKYKVMVTSKTDGIEKKTKTYS